MKVGFIGGNEITEGFISDFKNNKMVTETHFMEEDMVKSRQIIKRWADINYHVESTAFIKSIDALIVCGNHKKNHEYIVQAAKYGKHIILSDPHFLPIGIIRKLEHLESEAGIKIQIGGTEKYNSAFLAAKPFIKNPVFVDVARLSQYSPKNNTISVLHDLLYKDLDWVLSSINSNIRKISANSLSVTGEEIDFINTKLEFDNGCIANLTASRVSELNLNKARIYNANSILFIDFLNRQLKRSWKKTDYLEFEDLEITVCHDRYNQFHEFYKSINNEIEMSSIIPDFLKTKDVLELILEKIKMKTNPFVK
jgi:predicted dehydrogenase